MSEPTSEVRYRLPKSERISSRDSIKRLFTGGNSFLVHPFKVVWFAEDISDEPRAQMAVSVSKRYSKRAVKRNLIRRRIKEAYRLNKHELLAKLNETDVRLVFMFIYVGKQAYAFDKIEDKIIVSLKRLFDEYAKSVQRDINRNS